MTEKLPTNIEEQGLSTSSLLLETVQDNTETDPEAEKYINCILDEGLESGLSSHNIIARIRIANISNMSCMAARDLLPQLEPLDGAEYQSPEPLPYWDESIYRRATDAILSAREDELEARDALYESSVSAILEDDFSYRDVLGDEAKTAGSASARPEHAVRYAEELTRIRLVNDGTLEKAERDIREKFTFICSFLPEGVHLSPFADSQSWILWDIAKQETLKDQAYYGDVHEFKDFSGSPLGESEQSVEVRKAIVRRHLGWEMHTRAVRGEDIKWLDEILDDKTRTLLHSVGDEEHKGQLSSSDLTDLGWGVEHALKKHFTYFGSDPESYQVFDNPYTFLSSTKYRQ